MAQWEFLSELQKAQSLYLDAYRRMYQTGSSEVASELWNDLGWLDAETEKLVITWVLQESLS
jgi:hypothetical protein